MTVASQHILEVTGELMPYRHGCGNQWRKGRNRGICGVKSHVSDGAGSDSIPFYLWYGCGGYGRRDGAEGVKWGTGTVIRRIDSRELRQSDRTGFSAEYRRIVGELKKLSIQKAQDALMEIAGQMQTYRNSLQYRFEPLTKKDYEVLAGQLASYEYMDDAEEWLFRMAEKSG